MMQAIKIPFKTYFSALVLVAIFLCKGIGELSPRLLQFASGDYEMEMSTPESAKEKTIESINEAKEFTGNLYGDLFSSLKYPILSTRFRPQDYSLADDIYMPIITPPPRS